MPWKKGESGNPGGSTREKVFQGLFRAIGNEIETASGKRKARVLAEKVYALAMKGESWAAHLVMDRVDGRAAMEAAATIKSPVDFSLVR